MEFPYEAPTPPHEEVPATSPEQEVQLDDVIERIGRLSINDEAPPADQQGPSRKIPKWATKTLESGLAISLQSGISEFLVPPVMP